MSLCFSLGIRLKNFTTKNLLLCQDLIVYKLTAGMVFSSAKMLGKMEFLAQIAPFPLDGIGLISFKSKIRLAVSFTSLPFTSKEQLVDLEELLSTTEMLFHCLLEHLMEILLSSLVTGI